MQGAEYLVILNDRQLREAQIREHLGTGRSRANRRSWPRLTWLAELRSRRRTGSETKQVTQSEPLVARGQPALFVSID